MQRLTDESMTMMLQYIYRHFFGDAQGKLTGNQKWEAFCEGDGFGPLSPEELMETNTGFDWSHVRDSSDEALTRVYERVKHYVERCRKAA